MNPQPNCPVCGGPSQLLDVVDFNKSCEEQRGKYLPLSGRPIYYSICDACAFTFSPEFWSWTDDDFLRDVYNHEYVNIDPDYLEVRPKANAGALLTIFNNQQAQINHLDYGGGNGKLSQELVLNGWRSRSYDPFPSSDNGIETLGKFNLITAFEVFEHVPRPEHLMKNLVSLMDDSCLVLFTTLTSDNQIKKNQRLNWWYASPRNGHISLYTKHSLSVLGQKSGLGYGSFNEGFHFYVNKVPDWATHLVK